MSPNTEKINLNFEQILSLVKQLPQAQKLLLSKELEKDTLNSKITELLESFKTEELSLETIREEVEAVRTELYDRQQAD